MALTDNLISFWKMDEASGNALDAHGANALTDTNTVGAGTGKISGARSFASGSTEYFTKADNADLSTGDIDFTFSCWVQIANKSTFRGMVSKWQGTSPNEYSLQYDNASDRFKFFVSPNGTSNVSVTANNFGSPSTSTWHFIVFWHDSVANTINIQVNNGTVNSTSHSGGLTDTAQAFEIGRVGSGAGGYWDGLIDEVGFWKRVLTTDEKTQLYNSGSGLSYDSFNLEVTTTSLPNGVVGVGYDYTLAVTGGSGSITWTLVSGALPTGFASLPTDGSDTDQVCDTPGTYNFTVRATDSLGAYDEQALSITIEAAPTGVLGTDGNYYHLFQL